MNNTLLEKLILPIGDKVVGGEFIHWLHQFRELLHKNEDEIERIAEEKLQALLKFAVEHAPYYRDIATKAGKTADTVHLKDFPILEKKDIRSHTEGLLARPEKSLIKNSSSGSTGFQTSVYWSKREQSIHRATQILWWEWAGYKIGAPLLQTGINPNRTFLKSIKDKIFDTYYLQAFAHTKEEVREALLWASKQKEPVLAGYASSLYVLAQFAAEFDIQVNFKTAISWGDKMFDHYRARIKEVFGCKVHETYASAEGLMIATQKDLDYLYQMSTHTKLEIVDDQGNEVEDGKLGHVIVTNLNAYSMPLIRYRIGDLAIKLPKEDRPNNAELGFPCLAKVVGRDTDLVKTRSGNYMVVHSFTGIFEHIPEIKQFCVIQENLDGITIKYIPDNQFSSEMLTTIEKQIIGYLQESFVIKFEEVAKIPSTPSGKPQIIVSKLN